MLTLREQLVQVSYVFAVATGAKKKDDDGPSLVGASMKIFGDGKTLPRVASGSDVTTKSFERAMQWFSDNWPDGAEWPEEIARPQINDGEFAKSA